MKPLSPAMRDALAACPSAWERCPTYAVREVTRVALEERGLVEFDHRRVWLDIAQRESVARYVFWRLTDLGVRVSAEFVRAELSA